MVERDEAVVLQQRGRKIALLSRTRGRIDLLLCIRSRAPLLSSGTIISYILANKATGLPIAQETMVEYVPLVLAHHDIHFLHYLLELCHFFIPAGSGGCSIFLLVDHIYRNFQGSETAAVKKLVLCKALAHLGMYPSLETIEPCVATVLALPIDNMGISALELIDEQTLDQWLTWSITWHPHHKLLKAMSYIIKK